MSAPWQRGRLIVDSSNRKFVHEDGTPFFYLADTAWELFHRLTLEEVDIYLGARQAQGFNVIQCVLLAELDGIRTPNRYGETPLIGEDPDRLNPAYWAHVDAILDKLAEHGMYAALLPTWGDKMLKGTWGDGPVIFNPEKMLRFARTVSRRFAQRPNIIWVVGGDRDPTGYEEIFRAEAKGLREGDPYRRLMTMHPQGEMSSSQHFHDEEWLDFNMLQTGHVRVALRPDQKLQADYALSPVKPVLDGEPRYENHAQFSDLTGLHMDDSDCRRAAYSTVFSGAAGVTYGCHAVWQMASSKHIGVNRPLGSWAESLQLPGAWQYGRLKSLMLSLPFLELEPFSGVSGGEETDWAPPFALATADGSTLVIYSPHGRPVQVEASGLKHYRLFNPRNGSQTNLRTFEGIVPGLTGSSQGNDFVAILSR